MKMLFWFAWLIATAVSLWLPGNLDAFTRPSKDMATANSVRGSSWTTASPATNWAAGRLANRAEVWSGDWSFPRPQRTAEAAGRRSTRCRYIGAPRAVGRSRPACAVVHGLHVPAHAGIKFRR